LDFQAAGGSHSHNGRLNLQLFYEGVNLLPDFGYASRLANVTEPPWKDYKYNFMKMPIQVRSKLFREDYVKQPQSHCMALVDGVNHKRGPTTFHRFLGGHGLEEPGYSIQMVEADARAVFSTNLTFKGSEPEAKGKEIVSRDPSKQQKVSRFRRQLVTITLPNDRSLMLDVFRIKGGKRHEMFWHVPAGTAETSLGQPEELKHQNVQEYMRSIHGSPSQQFKYSPKDSALKYLNTPKRWKTPTGVWRAEWLIQPSEFEPVTVEGRKRYKKWKEILHDVKLRIWGFVNGDEIENDEIITARGLWPSGMAEKSKRGSVVALADTLDFLIESRWSGEAPLTSTFVHLLEPYNPDQGPALVDVEELKGESDEATDGCAVRLKIRKGESKDQTSELLVATTVNGGDFQGQDVRLRGRLGMVCRDDLNLVLYDGIELHTEDFGVELEPGWRLKLVEVVGDLTGHPEESALIVDSTRPLPTDKTLVGQMLTVYHQISDIHTTGYTIDNIHSLGGSRYRIDLRGCPPFIQFKTRVRKLDENNSSRVYGSSPNTKGACGGLFQGRRILFQRTGFSSAIKAILWARESGTDLIEMETARGEGDIAVGDPFIIHTIQPGDEVVIPSLFAVRRDKMEKDHIDLKIFSTGTAKLRVPDHDRKISLVSKGQPVPFSHEKKGNQIEIIIDRNNIKDGCAVLRLNNK